MKEITMNSRRHFLKTLPGLSLAAGLAGARSVRAAAEKPRKWTVAIRDTHLKTTGKADCWSALKDLRAQGVEVGIDEALRCVGLHHPERRYGVATADDLNRLKDDLAAHKIALTAFCMANRLDERLDEEAAWTRKVAEAAQALGVKVIRIDVVPRKVAAGEFLPFAIKACQQLCQAVRDTVVRLGIENHGPLTNVPAFLDRLFEGVGSARLGLTLDVMNFYWYGHPLDEVYRICERFAGRAFHTHCKNLRYPEAKRNERRPMGWEYERHAAPLYEGDLDYRRIAAILRQAGYQGDLCVENESLGHFPEKERPEVLRKELALLKELA